MRVSDAVSRHVDLTGVTADQHHAQVHAVDGANHTGVITPTQHAALLGPASAHRHSDLAGIGTNDHHAQSHDHSVAGDGTALVPATLTIPAATMATQAQMEAQSAVNNPVPPNLVRNSPGVAKGWGIIQDIGALRTPSYNITSVTDTGIGDSLVVWNVDFSTATYVALCTMYENTNEHAAAEQGAVGSTRVTSRNLDTPFALVDAERCVTAFGDQ